MKHGRLLTLLLLPLLPALAPSQEPWQFRWTKGAKLDYQVRHVTEVAEVVDGKKFDSTSRLSLVKRWTVLDVDTAGVATVQLSLVAMRNEQVRPTGETILFDSQDLEKSNPELREAMSKFIGKTLAVLRLDRNGQLVEVKEGSAAKYEAEPPFVVVLPGIAPKAGQAWVRSFNITLEPPLGTGEKIAASQRYDCAAVTGKLATLKISTEVKKVLETPREQIPVYQKMAQGQAIFDTALGRLHAVNLTIDRIVENHEGPGSTYRFQSTYTEQVME